MKHNVHSHAHSQQFQTGNVVLISISHFFYDLYGSFLAPLLPLLITKLGFSYSLAGVLAAAQKLPSLCNPLVGIMADKFRMRFFTIITPAVVAVVMSFLGSAPSYSALLILAVTAGFCSACYHVPAPVMVKRLAGNRVGKGVSIFLFGGQIGRTLGPMVIVGAVSWWGLENTYRLSFFGIVASLFLFMRLKNISIQQDFTPQTQLTGLKETSKALLPLFRSIAGIIIFKGVMLAALASFLPIYLTVKGSSVWVAGVSLSIFQIGGVAGTLIVGSLSDKLGRKNVLFIVAVILPILMGGFLLSDGLLILPVLAILGFFLSAAEPTLLALVQDNSSGHPAYANGVYMMLHFVIFSLMTMAVGISSDKLGFENTYRLAALLSFGTIPCVFLLPGKIQLDILIPDRRSSAKETTEVVEIDKDSR